jgi:hypothetical protein
MFWKFLQSAGVAGASRSTHSLACSRKLRNHDVTGHVAGALFFVPAADDPQTQDCRRGCQRSQRISHMQIRMKSPLLVVALIVLWAFGAAAQLTVLNSNVPTAFAMTGFLQAAMLKAGGAPNAGGTLTINNITVIVPDNSVIQMPAHALTWAELFDPAQSAPMFNTALPAQATPPINHPAANSAGQPMTGLALSDAPATPAAGTFPGLFPSCEVTVIGNIDTSGASGNPPGSYIAALTAGFAGDCERRGQRWPAWSLQHFASDKWMPCPLVA